ncbi:hypothetical protein Dsin_000871 [Dipteronia sinensis]|uniref:DDE Tnp4 domain-containing protein n=1 Tax=Dipteronia sinensis TaxID=43782 RepID=A0AAE0B458_9ROSI|nr:hypothetical protein Dsin_000871 [Dipteronia sinensis]
MPKRNGGLGIKKMKGMNQAFLAKIGWRLLHNEDEFWVKILKHKYLQNKSLLDIDLTYGVKLLTKGLKWRIGKGIKFVSGQMIGFQAWELLRIMLLPILRMLLALGVMLVLRILITCFVIAGFLLVFEHDFSIPQSLDMIITSFCKDWLNTNVCGPIINVYSISEAWVAPSEGWVKLSVDDSWDGESSIITAGRVLRNHKKEWINGFVMNIGVGNVLEAEVWGLFEGQRREEKKIGAKVGRRKAQLPGAIDGTHIQVNVSREEAPRYRGRKEYPTQNVMVACGFDMRFTCVFPGWEGTASDSRIIKNALKRENKLVIPNGKFYLVDAVYMLRSGFITPYRGVRYHLKQYSMRAPENYQELFNFRHASLSNVIETAFRVLKKRFPIISIGTRSHFSVGRLTKIVLACCILHNYLMG